MSKRFKSQTHGGHTLTVGEFAGKLNLTVSSRLDAIGVSLSPEDALALVDEVHEIQARLDDARRAQEAEEAARAAEAKLTKRRNKYVRDIHERSGREWRGSTYASTDNVLRAAVDLLIERDDELIEQEAGMGLPTGPHLHFEKWAKVEKGQMIGRTGVTGQHGSLT